MSKLQKAHNRLRRSHKDIRKAFSKIDDSLSEALLGEYDSPKLRRSLRKYGSGHRLHGVPKSVEEMITADALVLIAGTSPKLSKNTDFNPTLPLKDMSYWRDGKRLRSRIHSARSGEEYRLHFMSWHQNFTIHGEDDAHALRNLRLLSNNNANFQALINKDEEKATKFINHCKGWLSANGKPMVLVTHTGRNHFDEPILSLISDNGVAHIKANLRGSNYQIMGRISDVLP